MRPSIVAALRCAVLGCFVGSVMADGSPERSNDTGYGMALYEYHQGNFFQALTRLNLANAEGGIGGHGDHPLLVEGGLMLAYGMTREAQALFLELLDESDVPPETRNQAWFYLGKVLWLEEDLEGSKAALDRVDGELLEETDPELHAEWLYLNGQWLLQSQSGDDARLDEIIDTLPDSSPWQWYLRYNRAVENLAVGDVQSATSEFSAMVSELEPDPDLPPDIASELSALEQQARLSLGRLHLADDEFAQAMAVLDDIPLDGMLSDQALFDYAVAASRMGQNALALQALETLQSRPLFTPWLQQVPYAKAFTIEQMGRPKSALEAYRSAAEHYIRLDRQLEEEQSELTEERLTEALSFVREGNAGGPGSAEPSLGGSAMMTDAYGRVQVRPGDFSLAEMLAGETFQLALRDLHELYRLRGSLDEWRRQLASFELMLDTRSVRRAARIQETREALANLNVDEWVGQQAEFRRRIEQASEEENAAFFMTATQRQLKQTLDEVEATLALLPDDESTREQRKTYERMRAYFNWWLADEYAVNRWAAVRELEALDEAMETFISQRRLMEQEMASDDRLDEFAARIAQKNAELTSLQGMLEDALSQTRENLLALVRTEIADQRREIAGYLRASRHAQARLADELFLRIRETASKAGGVDE